MKVSEIMMRTPAGCTRETNLGAAVEIMWNRNCGFLPVVDERGCVNAVVTDRDICIALGTRNRLPGQITVAEVARKEVVSCQPNDDIRTALATMREAGVRRLPVVDWEGKLQGVLSMDDVVLRMQRERFTEYSTNELVGVLKAIYAHDLPALAEAKTVETVLTH
jgi:CBS domain-containing protein